MTCRTTPMPEAYQVDTPELVTCGALRVLGLMRVVTTVSTRSAVRAWVRFGSVTGSLPMIRR